MICASLLLVCSMMALRLVTKTVDKMAASITSDIFTDTGKEFPLSYLVREPKLVSARKRAIILLHGVGSNEQDLFSLADRLPADSYVISPRGQFMLGTDRYAWYQVDFSTGQPVINAAQEASSRELLLTFIRQIKQRYKVNEVYIGGFSQGAIMSYGIALTHPDEVQGLIALSGRLLDEIKPLVFAGKKNYLKGLKVFIAHGVQDTILPVYYARTAKEYLEQLAIPLAYQEYPTGHEISSPVLDDLNNWLR